MSKDKIYVCPHCNVKCASSGDKHRHIHTVHPRRKPQSARSLAKQRKEEAHGD